MPNKRKHNPESPSLDASPAGSPSTLTRGLLSQLTTRKRRKLNPPAALSPLPSFSASNKSSFTCVAEEKENTTSAHETPFLSKTTKVVEEDESSLFSRSSCNLLPFTACVRDEAAATTTQTSCVLTVESDGSIQLLASSFVRDRVSTPRTSSDIHTATSTDTFSSSCSTDRGSIFVISSTSSPTARKSSATPTSQVISSSSLYISVPSTSSACTDSSNERKDSTSQRISPSLGLGSLSEASPRRVANQSPSRGLRVSPSVNVRSVRDSPAHAILSAMCVRTSPSARSPHGISFSKSPRGGSPVNASVASNLCQKSSFSFPSLLVFSSKSEDTSSNPDKIQNRSYTLSPSCCVRSQQSASPIPFVPHSSTDSCSLDLRPSSPPCPSSPTSPSAVRSPGSATRRRAEQTFAKLRVLIPEDRESLLDFAVTPVNSPSSGQMTSQSAGSAHSDYVLPIPSSSHQVKGDHCASGRNFAVSMKRGARRHQEDTFMSVPCFASDPHLSLYGVFDGHGTHGKQAAEFAATSLPELLERSFKQPALSSSAVGVSLNSQGTVGDDAITACFQETFSELDRNCIHKLRQIALPSQGSRNRVSHGNFPSSSGSYGQTGGGTTAVVAYVDERHKKLLVANVGDSRCVLSRGGVAVALSRDHTPNLEDEKQRVEQSGGQIVWVGTWRVEGILAVTRSIGDARLKPLVSPSPEVMCQSIEPQDQFLILASDGLWNGISNERAVQIAAGCASTEAACEALCEAALEHGVGDNVTVLVVDLQGFFRNGHSQKETSES